MAISHAPVYLLLGPEEGERREFIRQLTKNLQKQFGEVELHRFYAFDASLADVLPLLRSGSLFGGHTLALMHNAEELKKKEEADAFAAYCKNPSETGTLILTSDRPGIDKRLEKAVSRDQKRIFWEMFENQKQGWLINYARKRGVTLDPEAAELVLELVENNKLALAAEIDRLCLFFPERIGAEDVETYIYHAKEENVFTLFGSLAEADFQGSLEILEKLLLSSEHHPVQLVAGLLWQSQNLLAIKSGEAAHRALEELFTQLNIRSKRNQRIYATAAKRYSLEDCENIVLSLNDTDEQLRSTPSAMHPGVLRDLVYTIVVRKGRSHRSLSGGPGAPSPSLR